uniref:Uncharacterized protein n=1 Tax=Rhodnius prolixus TaxID=13249 RepID=T1HMA5_RHOPR
MSYNEKFNRKENEEKERKVRSNYFQTEFSVSINKRKDEKNCSSSSSFSAQDDKFDGNQKQRKKNISVQAGRNIIGQEELPKERKKWIRPPLVGQASTTTEVVIPAHQVPLSDSDEEIIETSHHTVEPSAFASRTDYRNRKEYLSEKPPEGGAVEQGTPPSQGDYIKSASPTSSVTSSRPLEWDSGADVGYFQFYSGQANEPELSTLERLALERGSATLLTRSDPEGTTCSSVKPNVVINRPAAESTPVSTLSSKTKDEEPDRVNYYPLFPEVIVQEHGQVSDSDIEINRGRDLSVKKSSSLEVVTELKPDEGPATFPRSQSQTNVVFNINPHLQKILANTKSNSSSSVATVVTGKKKYVQNSPDNEITTDDRANSFEYLPGHMYENKSNDIPLIEGHDFKKDVERGVQLLAEFVKGTNANNTLLKKELLQRVVEGLISAEYLSDNDLSPRLQRCVTRRSHNRDVSGESSAGENLQTQSSQRRAEKDSTTGTGDISNPTNNSSAQNTSESRNSEPLLRRLPKLMPKRMIKSSVNATKESKSIDSTKSSDMSKSSSDWKEPVTKSEKIFEHKKRKGISAPLDKGLMQYLYSERENQIDWIKKEISHLSNLKQF